MQEATNQGGKESELFSRAGLDHPNQLERPREIGLCEHAISAAQRSRRGRRGPEDQPICPSGSCFGSLEACALPSPPPQRNSSKARPRTLITSPDVNVRYPADHGLNADSVQCRRCANGLAALL